MELALGQYILYLSFLEMVEPDRKLYVAITDAIYDNIFGRKSIQLLVQRNKVPLIVVNLAREEVVTWIN